MYRKHCARDNRLQFLKNMVLMCNVHVYCTSTPIKNLEVFFFANSQENKLTRWLSPRSVFPPKDKVLVEWTGLLQVIQKDLEIQEIYQRYDLLSPESLGLVVGIKSLRICTN